jgi:hypothetical protein
MMAKENSAEKRGMSGQAPGMGSWLQGNLSANTWSQAAGQGFEAAIGGDVLAAGFLSFYSCGGGGTVESKLGCIALGPQKWQLPPIHLVPEQVLA